MRRAALSCAPAPAALAALAALALAAGCSAEAPAPAEDSVPAGIVREDPVAAAVADPGRPEADRARDATRRPETVLKFFGIERGMRVADLMAGTGYYTEILSNAVGRDGTVYCHNSPFVLERFAEGPLSERLARPGFENVERLVSPPDALELPDGLDAALLIRFYHDFYWQGVDRAAFNRAVFAALKPGGVFGVVDHHAEAGSRDRDVQTLHRVDAEMVREEILAAGFVLEATSDALADPSDTRDWNIFAGEGSRRDATDRFVFRFRKPVE